MAHRASLVVLGCAFALAIAAPADITQQKEAIGRQPLEAERKLETRTVEEVEGYKCGFFELIDGKSLYGYNSRIIYDISAQQCMEECVMEYSIYCRSADYNHQSSTCYLSSESDETQPQDFDDNFNTVYYRRLCEQPTDVTPSGSGWYNGYNYGY